MLEEIIRSCFSNPNRSDFPDFLKVNQMGDCYLCPEEASAESFIKKINPELAPKFNAAKFNVHDTSRLRENPWNRVVDEENYLLTMRSSRWCGPYRAEHG